MIDRKDALLNYIGKFDQMIDDLVHMRIDIINHEHELVDTELGKAIAAIVRAQEALIRKRENAA